jgi:hypothetical protein
MSYGQGGPFGASGSTPDWAALAEESERRRARRRRWTMIGGAALAAALVGGIVGFAVVSESGGGPSDDPTQALPTPEELPSGPSPQPTFEQKLPPAPPEDYLKNPEKDTAPISTETLFPDEKVNVDGRAYTRAATSSTKDCASAATDRLAPLLERNDCRRMFRVTLRREGLAVTVGLAVFASEKQAAAVKSDYEPNVEALAGDGVAEYCTDVECRTTVNSLGRYAVLTVSGHTDGTPAGDADEPAIQAALDGSAYGYDRLIDRGERQSEADAARG